MDAETAAGFCAVARRLADEARQRGLLVPGFRSPPRIDGVQRSLRRVRGGSAVIAVQRRGRAGADVVRDMVDGIVVVNGLSGEDADRLRVDLLTAVA